ncbi:DUF3619 family protein [Dissulfurirhabdus thermomarina]|uniref:DUF3619 family protein n=1 Tax=Dissulfurirhabdus thermomarina TaxID=1765737 RepID=A0A6N9TT32_DISTH|nr:DUF3619 family protein [Dissulfurirhabdus thermomarina]NDY42904.1 DUF3619 family protein [Dissulfurirhabdus thermomarina]NMX24129.1 DUF3619 family protein [Dissulfurirhabdus thermomarina]
MKGNETDRFVERTRRLLDQGARDIDAATLARLDRARRRALAGERPARRLLLDLRRLFPAAALLGAAAAAALALVLRVETPRTAAPLAAALEDLEVVTAPEPLDFYADLDFYAWMAAETDDAG